MACVVEKSDSFNSIPQLIREGVKDLLRPIQSSIDDLSRKIHSLETRLGSEEQKSTRIESQVKTCSQKADNASAELSKCNPTRLRNELVGEISSIKSRLAEIDSKVEELVDLAVNPVSKL